MMATRIDAPATQRPARRGAAQQPASGGRPPRRSWPWALAAFLVLALLGGAAYVAYRTPVLGVQSVAVSATGGELTDALRTEVSDATGVATGTPLLRVDLESARRRVLAVPQVASASVARRWPHELQVAVTLRTPAALTKANGSLWLLDATGVPYLKVAGSAAPAGLLTIDLATPAANDPATMAGLAVVGQLRAPVRGQIATVSAPSPYRVTLGLRDGRTVIWGSPDQSAKKMQILPAVLDRPGTTFDVSDPDIVTVR